jgi:hypothetical protein
LNDNALLSLQLILRSLAMTASFGIDSASDFSYSTRKLTVTYAISISFVAVTGIAMVIANFLLRSMMLRPLVAPTSAAVAYVPSSKAIAQMRLALSPVNVDIPYVLAGLAILTASSAVPGIMWSSKAFLKATFVMTGLTILSEIIFGLSLWVITLRPGTTFLTYWKMAAATAELSGSRSQAGLSGSLIAAMQDSFDCCGYAAATSPINSTTVVRQFMPSAACPSLDVAASKNYCSLLFADRFAEPFL